MSIRTLTLLAAVLTATAGVAAPPAHAAFPGANGRIAFDSGRAGGTQNIFTMRPDGSDVRQLTFLLAGQGGASEASWSADGRSLAFARGGDANPSRLFVINADGSGQHQVFSDDAAIDDIWPSFSPDGSRISFGRCAFAAEECAIYTIKTDGHGLTAVTHFNQTVGNFDVDPEYAPDGSAIAFGSFNRGGVQAGVYVVGLHGSAVRMLTPSGLNALGPNWSPDGRRLAVFSNCCNQANAAIWTIAANGSDARQVSFPGAQHDHSPTYSPRGDKIAFERNSPDFSTEVLTTVNADGTDLVPIQPDAYRPSWGTLR